MTTLPEDVNEYNRKVIEEFRAKGGPGAGRPLLLLTTTGARSGRRRTTPVMYLRDGDRVLVIASNAGAPKHPDWYHNLVAHPEVTVEMAGDTFDANAVPLEGDERDRQFARLVEQYPFFGQYQAGVQRTIPVVALLRR